MALIPYPEKDGLSAQSRAIVDAYPNNLALMLAGLGDAFPPLMQTIGVYTRRGIVSHGLRELITLRVADKCRAEYVLNQHRGIARRVGVTDAQVAAARAPLPSAIFTDTENAVLQFVDELLVTSAATAASAGLVAELMAPAGIQEVLLIVAMNHFLAKYSSALSIDMDRPIDVDPGT